MNSELLKNWVDILEESKNIIIIQADNPDGDSLSTSLALEGILSSLGKNPILYCGVEIPSYLRYMEGWDRIQHNLPHVFDASIIVDTSSISLLETLVKSGQLAWIKTKPCIILDHHQTTETIDFATLIINESAVSTGELVFKICQALRYEISTSDAEFIAYSILSDSLGLTSESVTSYTFTVMSQLIDLGVSIAKLDDARRALNKKSRRIAAYKGRLLERIEYYDDPRIATVTIPWEEIEDFSHEYNPSMLVIDEMRMVENVQVAIAFKTYPDGKITAKIRSNYGYKIAGELAEFFGGGGHGYAAGFKLQDKSDIFDIKVRCVNKASELLGELGNHDEAIQHTF